jgi:histidine triad (HIT) family protein
MDNCIFCEIVAKKKPATLVFEDDKTLAFLDILPVAKGHTLVIPKNHFATLYDIKTEDIQAVGVTVSKIAKALKKALMCDGINVYQGNEKAALQEIDHVHFHIIPRWFDDSIVFIADRKPLEDDPELLSSLLSILDDDS